MRIIIAILALAVVYMLAQWANLPLTVWGFKNLWAVILFVLIVIFQKEIREALGSITLPAFLLGGKSPSGISSKAMDALVDASFRLAEKRVGGLVVIQKTDDLQEFIHGETTIDSEINEDLLVSIFNPGSPLHDGAVIVVGDRIRFASALLPVSQSSAIPREWGTRHRAGIGITEVSDADCIIVSEERGEVMLAHGGRAEKKETREELKKSLYEPAVHVRTQGLRTKVFSNLPVKLLFLLLVCLFWIFVVGIRQGEITFDVPLEYYSIPQNLRIVGEPPREINVRLKSSERLLSTLNPSQIRVRVNLSDAHPGNNQILLTTGDMNVPSGISVTYFYPRRINVQLAEYAKSGRK